MSTDCFNGTEGLGHCGTGLKDGVFRGFCWACGAVGSFRSHGCGKLQILGKEFGNLVD